jgi:mRNA-degrading endonuclease toxin of MazEF toxin-antitoxin module
MINKFLFEKLDETLEKFNSLVFSNSAEDNLKIKDFYISKLKQWILELPTKNFLIKSNPKRERVHRLKQRVYWIDFGVNIGSEFNFPHFCVVLKEFDYTAIVIPLSTVKEDDADWKSAQNLIVEIGVLENLPENKKSCYAMVNQIRSVSKQRLSDYKDKSTGKFIEVKLSDSQMNMIYDSVAWLANIKK